MLKSSDLGADLKSKIELLGENSKENYTVAKNGESLRMTIQRDLFKKVDPDSFVKNLNYIYKEIELIQNNVSALFRK